MTDGDFNITPVTPLNDHRFFAIGPWFLYSRPYRFRNWSASRVLLIPAINTSLLPNLFFCWWKTHCTRQAFFTGLRLVFCVPGFLYKMNVAVNYWGGIAPSGIHSYNSTTISGSFYLTKWSSPEMLPVMIILSSLGCQTKRIPVMCFNSAVKIHGFAGHIISVRQPGFLRAMNFLCRHGAGSLNLRRKILHSNKITGHHGLRH